MASITLEGVSKRYDSEALAVDDVSLEIADGEFIVLVGPSGCGKSTLLRMIAGLEEVTEGGILLGENDITYLAPRDRNVAMVFQNYALYPHMTVRKNLGFGLKLHRTPKRDIARRVDAVAETLGITELLDRKPAQLSGGQRQRVAMGRALVREPAAFLMDEPLSNLDAKLRVTMRAELARLHRELGVTTVYVTHDQVEAMTLGQRVAVLRDGRLQQVATSSELFRAPANLFCAGFIGSPPMNLVEAVVTDGVARFGDLEITVGASVPHGRVIIGLRPSDLCLASEAPERSARLRAEAIAVEDLGAQLHVGFGVGAPLVDPDRGLTVDAAGEPTPLIDAGRARWHVELPDRCRCQVGDVIELAAETDRFHWFDPATGERLGGPR